MDMQFSYIVYQKCDNFVVVRHKESKTSNCDAFVSQKSYILLTIEQSMHLLYYFVL